MIVKGKEMQIHSNLFAKIKFNLNQVSLQTKLIGMYIFIIMIPISTFTYYYSNEIYDNAIEDITNKNEYAIEIEKIHILNNIESMRRTAQIVISDREFIDFVKTRNEFNINELLSFKMSAFANVSKLQINNPSIENVRMYTTNPYINEMWPILFNEERIKKEPWLAETIKRNGMELWWVNQQNPDILHRFPVDNTSKILFLREIDYPKDEHLGVIEISMLLKNFYPKMFSPENDGKSAMVVLDQDMNLIQNTNNHFLSENNIDIGELKKNFSQHKKKKTFSFQFKNHKTPYLVVATYFEGLDSSYMLNIISLEDIFAETKKTRNLIISGTVFLVFILSVLTYFVVSFLLKKMYVLMETMKRVEKGEFDVKVDMNGSGEIGQLATHFRNMLKKINSLIDEAIHKQAANKETELKALKTQIDSHFLYNTLENVKMMAEIEGHYQISDAVTSLGEMMRYNLKWQTDFVLLQEEITHIRNYVDIMNIRLDNRLVLKVNIPEELLDHPVLKISLQPIVENSIKHGIRPKLYSQNGLIEVTAGYQDGAVMIEIMDNGIGISEEGVMVLNKYISGKFIESDDFSRSGNGIGLQNVHERIQLYYGNDYGIEVVSKEGEYTKVIVRIPCLLVKGGENDA